VPKYFLPKSDDINEKNAYREILKAEPNVVDLLKQEPYFYETGIHVGALVAGDEENLLKAVMHNVRQIFLLPSPYAWFFSVQTFQRRSKDVVNLSQADPSKEVLCRERLLSKEEKSLMHNGRHRWVEVENWLAGKVSSAELAAVSVSNYLKRKRPQNDSSDWIVSRVNKICSYIYFSCKKA
jgi:hypothetical protein